LLGRAVVVGVLGLLGVAPRFTGGVLRGAAAVLFRVVPAFLDGAVGLLLRVVPALLGGVVGCVRALGAAFAVFPLRPVEFAALVRDSCTAF
jgi:hypothetical protein